ncbi:MAG: hypothetical protein U0704_18055 [Candidatus Eisenbacteria bacterium]
MLRKTAALGLLLCSLLLVASPPAGFAQSLVRLTTWPVGTLTAFGLAVDAAGDVYVSGSGPNIDKFTNDGQWLQSLPANGWDIVIGPDGNVYCSSGELVHKLTPTGQVLASWGPDGTAATVFGQASAIAVNSQGEVFVADQDDFHIHKFSSTGVPLLEWVCPSTVQAPNFGEIYAMVVDAQDRLYVAEAWAGRIRRFDGSGQLLGQWDVPNGTAFGLAFDREGMLYVADMGGSTIVRTTPDGTVLERWGSEGDGPDQFLFPWSVATDRWGNLFITDMHAEVHKYGPPATPAHRTTWGRVKQGR